MKTKITKGLRKAKKLASGLLQLLKKGYRKLRNGTKKMLGLPVRARPVPQDGKMAFYAGYDLTRNPHVEGSVEHAVWANDWATAKKYRGSWTY